MVFQVKEQSCPNSLYMTMKVGRNGAVLGSIAFHESPYEVLQRLHIVYIERCRKQTKWKIATKTFRDFINNDSAAGDLKLYKCIPGQQPENLNVKTRVRGRGCERWFLLELAEQHGFTLDDEDNTGA
jgi:hypothetical protein